MEQQRQRQWQWQNLYLLTSIFANIAILLFFISAIHIQYSLVHWMRFQSRELFSLSSLKTCRYETVLFFALFGYRRPRSCQAPTGYLLGLRILVPKCTHIYLSISACNCKSVIVSACCHVGARVCVRAFAQLRNKIIKGLEPKRSAWLAYASATKKKKKTKLNKIY